MLGCPCFFLALELYRKSSRVVDLSVVFAKRTVSVACHITEWHPGLLHPGLIFFRPHSFDSGEFSQFSPHLIDCNSQAGKPKGSKGGRDEAFTGPVIY